MARKKKVFVPETGKFISVDEVKKVFIPVGPQPTDNINDEFEAFLDLFEITTNKSRFHRTNNFARRNFFQIKHKYSFDQLKKVMISIMENEPECVNPEYVSRPIVVTNYLSKEKTQDPEQKKTLQNSERSWHGFKIR